MAEILRKTAEKDKALEELAARREHANKCRTLQRQLDLDLKREKVRGPKC